MLNTTELCREYAQEYNVSIKSSEMIFETVFEFLSKKLYDDNEDLAIRKFGTFRHQVMAEKNAKHPVTGEMVVIAPRNIIKFRQSEARLGSSTKTDR